MAISLRLRRDHPDLFTGYEPLTATGAASEHVVAFDRGGAITVATRLPVGLAARGGWGDTMIELPYESVNAFNGSSVPTRIQLADLFSELPVALLVRR